MDDGQAGEEQAATDRPSESGQATRRTPSHGGGG